jgi:hypothetical protein
MVFTFLKTLFVRYQFGSPSLRQTATASETVISCDSNGAQCLPVTLFISSASFTIVWASS